MPVHKLIAIPSYSFVGRDWSDGALLDRPDERKKKVCVCLEIAATTHLQLFFLAFATINCETPSLFG